MKKIQFLFLSLLLSYAVLAQTNHSYQYTLDDFLPTNDIRSIFKDSKNNLWIGTDNGILKITGTEKTKYTIDDGLASNKVWSIEEDKNGVIWVGCFHGGVSKWNGKSFDVFATKEKLGDDKIRMLYYSKKHDIMFVGGNYTFSRIKNDSIKYYRNYITNPHVIVTNFLENDSVVFALTYGKHAWRYYPEKDTAIVFSKFDKGKNHNRWYYSTSNKVLKNKDTIVSFHDKGINLFTKNGMIPYRGFGQIFSMSEDNNRVWMAAWNGAAAHAVHIGNKGGLYTYENNQIIAQNESYGIETEQCFALWKDTLNKQLLIGTNNKGLYVLSDHIFKNYDASFFREKELATTQIFYSDSSLYFNGNKNLIKWTNSKIEKLSKNKIHDAIKREHLDAYIKMGYEIQKHTQEVNYMFEIQEHDNYLYINNKMGLFRCSKNNLNTIEYLMNPRGRSVEFHNGKLYSNAHSYLIIYDTLKWKKNKKISMPTGNLYGREGQFVKWDTVFYAAKGKNTFYEIYQDSAHTIHIPDLLTGVRVNDFITKNGKEFYFAMRDGKILKAIKNDTAWTWNNIKLPCDCGNSIRWLLKKGDFIYFSSNTGLGFFRYFKSNVSEFKFLTQQQGYFGQDSEEAVFGANGNIFIPAIDRIIEINVEQLHEYSRHLGELNLISTEIEHKDTKNELIKLNNKNMLKLTYKENTFNVNFNLSQPQITANVNYQYFLEGYQNKWSEPSSDNIALFNRVPSGKYIFKVKAYTTTQPAEIVELEYPIVILKPFYQTWLFLIVIILLLVVSILFLIKRQRKKEYDKWQTSLRIKELEKQSLLSKINPHFLFNSLNSVQKFILNKQNEDAVLFIGKFSKLIRQTLENSVEDTVVLEKEIDLLKNYMNFERNRCEIPFKYHIKIDETIDTEESYIPPMLIQPFIENSIKHGVDHLKKQGNISLEFNTLNENVLRIIVVDDGIGREQAMKLKKEQSKSSLGIKLVMDRIQLYNDVKWKEPIYKVEYHDLCDEKNIALGTKVSLFIPYFED